MKFKVFELINMLKSLPPEEQELEVFYVTFPALNESDVYKLPEIKKITPKPYIQITEYRKLVRPVEKKK